VIKSVDDDSVNSILSVVFEAVVVACDFDVVASRGVRCRVLDDHNDDTLVVVDDDDEAAIVVVVVVGVVVVEGNDGVNGFVVDIVVVVVVSFPNEVSEFSGDNCEVAV